ncbi:hypothetical protein ACIOEZ_16650 [Streptomyces sp. NPDC087866]|uniref:hypothetical protein n=1 Tax=unclassified Streptomyces TaxID=2593676 RepID=UPI0033A46812
MSFLDELLAVQRSHAEPDTWTWLPDNGQITPRRFLESCTARDWVQGVAAGAANPTPPREIGSAHWLLAMLEYTQPGFALQAALLAMPDAEVVFTFASSEPDTDHDPELLLMCAQAVEAVQEVSSAHAPVVVLTEGRSDVAILEPALELLYPHVTDLVRFMDYSSGPQGGAGPLASTVRAFAAARIANPVVALFDNDTGAADAIRALSRMPLPDNIKFLQFPELALASSYPTLGPPTTEAPAGNLSTADVNGLAGSIELYLGRDVLSLPDGTFRPVQWSSYIKGSKRYQGEITDKGEIQDLYYAKLARAQKDPSVIAEQDWSGVRAILEMVIHAFD